MDLMTELKLVRGARLRWGLGTWICRSIVDGSNVGLKDGIEDDLVLDLEDGVEAGFVDGIEDVFVEGSIEGLSLWSDCQRHLSVK